MSPLPPNIVSSAEQHASAPPRAIWRLQLALARLVLSQAPPSAAGQLEIAERFLGGSAEVHDLTDARQDAWIYIGSLACYCTRNDSASASAVLACLEPDEAQHTYAALLEQLQRLQLCGVPEAEVLRALGVVAGPRGQKTPEDQQGN